VNSYLTHLSSFAIIEVSGNDASAFLQGQFTSDLGEIGNHQSAFSAWCNAQGRVIATFLVFWDKNRYLLLLPDTLIDSVCQRLKMFVLRSHVVISKHTQYTCIGLSSTHVKTIVDTLDNPNVFTTKIAGTQTDRIILILSTEILEEMLTRLASVGVQPAGPGLWQEEDIHTGIPWLSPQTSGEFLPQELDLEYIGALSYNKGCYPGQEIIARMHFRGRAKRSLCHGHTESGTSVPAPGTRLFSAPGSATTGMVISSARVSDALVRLLAVIDTELQDTGRAVLDGGDLVHFTPVSPRTNTP